METPRVKLLDDRVLVKPDEKITQSEHGLYIPESSQKEMHQGVVVAIGDGISHPNTASIMSVVNDMLAISPVDKASTMNNYATQIFSMLNSGGMKVSVGDKVVYGNYSGTDLEIEGVKYSIMRQSDIKLVMDKEIDHEQLKK